MKPRVIFVGVHNKPGLQPLDSNSRTGNLVDSIAYLCGPPKVDIVKTNLFDTFAMPPDFQNNRLLWVWDWKTRSGYKPGNIVVALGDVVQLHLRLYSSIPEKDIVCLTHPAARKINGHEPEYINSAVKEIRRLLP